MNKDHPSFIGVFKVPCYKGEAGNKAMEVFTKLKRSAKETASHSFGKVTPSHEEMQYRVMNS